MKESDFIMKDKIFINKKLIPYSFNILLGDINFEMEINYNETADLFTAALYKDNKCICEGEPIIYGMELFKDIYDYHFPAIKIVPLDEANENNTITYDNFSETVFLCIDDEEG